MPLALLLLLACPPASDPAPTCVPGQERCNGADDDCDGAVDELFDLDQDGYRVDEPGCRALGEPTDCDDDDPAVNPGAPEACGDEVDNDCSGLPDDAPDADQDGVGACGDCDDDDAFVYPGAAEACDGVDNDCSGGADEPWDADGDGVAACAGDCDDADPGRAPTLAEACNDRDDDCDGEVDEGFDADADGWETCRGDCDDADPTVNPVAPETCGDGLDNDCDPSTSEDGDLDGDGVTTCDGDCNDGSAVSYPGGLELCDGLDNDCDGAADNVLSCYGYAWWDDTHLVVTNYVTWDVASAVCAGAGMTLAVVDDAAENDTLTSIGYYWLGVASWIGLNDRDVEGTWVYEDGSAPAFTSWYSGEPNNSGEEDCTGVNFGAWGYWNDYSCTGSALPFVCELPATSE
jgi:hypothetical protein